MATFKSDENFYLPPEMHMEVHDLIGNISIIRKHGYVIKTDNSSLMIPVHATEEYKPQWFTNDMKLDKDNISSNLKHKIIELGTLFINFAATSSFLEDMGQSLVRYVREKISLAFSMEENRALILGNDKKNIEGILQEGSGAPQPIKKSNIQMLLMNMSTSIGIYKNDAVWITSAGFMAKIIDALGTTHLNMLLNANPKVKKTENHYILSMPVVLNDNVPEDTIILANLSYGYTFAEKGELTMQQTSSPLEVRFCFSTRVGGKVTNPDAIVIGVLIEE